MDNGKDYLHKIRRGHENLFGDGRAMNRMHSFGMFAGIPMRKDGFPDGDAPDIVDVEDAVAFLTLAGKKDFNENDIGTLFGHLESAFSVYSFIKGKHGDKDDEAKTRYRFFEPFFSAFGEILFNKSPKTDKEIEGVITLGESLIDALRGFKDEDFRASAILSMLSPLGMFADDLKRKGRMERRREVWREAQREGKTPDLKKTTKEDCDKAEIESLVIRLGLTDIINRAKYLEDSYARTKEEIEELLKKDGDNDEQ